MSTSEFGELQGAFSAEQLEKIRDDAKARGETVTGQPIRTEYEQASVEGIRGTVIPSANGDEGGSAGFNAHKLMPITVDPDIPGQSYVINNHSAADVGDVDKSQIPATGYDNDDSARAKAAAAMRRLEQASPTSESTEESAFVERLEPEQKQTPQTAPERTQNTPKAPTCRVVFDLGENVGTFDCHYHRVFQQGIYLVLVWDMRYTGTKFSPPTSLKRHITVIVGKEHKKMNVFIGPSFIDDEHDEEYTILLIDETRG